MRVYTKSDCPPIYAVIDEDRGRTWPDVKEYGEPPDGICAYVYLWPGSHGAWHWYCRWHQSLLCFDVDAVKAYRIAHGEPAYYEDQHAG